MIKFLSRYFDLNSWVFDLIKNKAPMYIVSEDSLSITDEKSLKNYFLSKRKEIECYKSKVENMWNSKSQRFLNCLKVYFNYSLISRRNIRVGFTFFTIFPRDLKKRKFLVPVLDNEDYLLSILFHEILHFMFFDKLDIYTNCIAEDLRLASELLIPVVFDFLERKNYYENLYVSNYCISGNQIKRGKVAFQKYLNHRNYKSFVEDLIQIVR